MNLCAGSSRGRVLSRQQVRLCEAPVELPQPGGHEVSHAQLIRDQVTGEITEIHLECGCGKITILECHYDDRPVSLNVSSVR